jgi:hypothetical protein
MRWFDPDRGEITGTDPLLVDTHGLTNGSVLTGSEVNLRGRDCQDG